MHWLYAGLGNPGKKYEKSRHNLGADLLSEIFGKPTLTEKKQFNSLGTEIKLADDTVIHLIFPLTFMNLSGSAVVPYMKKHNIIARNLIVFHDEIDLLPAQIKYKFGGGHRGHNGLRDIMAKLGSGDFHRIRLGVGRPENENFSVADYVLSRMPDAERPAVDSVLTLMKQNALPVS